MKISIRKFESKDIPKKVEWINNSENNKYLHYDIPLKIEKTEKWFEKNKDRTDRFDAVIEADGVPCGKKSGKKPYFIPGGGHGNLGTQAYVNCYNEIKEYEKANHIFFEYIFFASGTGTTQAGLL